MNIFEDGPYEVGGETDHDESLVPVPANSYLGRNEQRPHTYLPSQTLHCVTLPSDGPQAKSRPGGSQGPRRMLRLDSLAK